MGALTAVRGSRGGTTVTAGAVSSSDTISVAELGRLGAELIIVNGGGSSDTVAISDAGKTPSGGAGASGGGAVANGTAKAFFVSREQADPDTGLVTVTHSFTTSVTYWLVPKG
ncbi:MAG TPA: hypothetical protein VHA75_11380 [Rugosimonospora sp.]|nr:hypothetical protein [Rugosimonospora sp.]